jgi:outer membrane protein
MRANNKLSVIIFLFFTFWSQSMWSQSELTLEQCIKIALENSLSIKSSEINLKNNAIDVKSAKHARYPNLSTGTNVFWNFGRTIDPTTNTFSTNTFFNNGLSINSNALIYDGGAMQSNIKKAMNDAKALEKDLQQTKNDLALNVATLYLNALFAKENIATAQLNTNQSKSTLTQIQILVNAGSRPQNELLDVEAQIANDEQAVLVAKNNYTNALSQLKQVMLVNNEFDVVSQAKIDLTTDPDLVTMDELYKSALTTQYGIEAEELRLKSRDLDVKIAQAQRMPTLGVGANIQTNYSNLGQTITGIKNIRQEQPIEITIPGFPKQTGTIGIENQIPIFEKANYLKQFDNNLSLGAGFNINIPILNNYRTSAGIQKAKLSRESANIALENSKQDLKVRVQRALTDARAAKGAVITSEKVVAANQASFDNATKRYQLGVLNTLDLATARTRLDNAKNNLLIAKFDHLFKVKIVEFYQGKSITL